MADVTTTDTPLQAHPSQVYVRVDIPNQELRARDAAEVLLCLSELAGLIAGSDYVELAEADPAEAEGWKASSVVVNQMSMVTPNPWEILTVLPGCTPERVHAFVEALTSVCLVVRNRHADKSDAGNEKRELEEQLIEKAARLLVAQTADVPRTPPVEKVRELVERLGVLSVTIVDATVHRG
jgi:hypothetical protein